MTETKDFLQIYDLESFLLDTVRPRFHEQGWLSAFDLFCIIIWKANRAKSMIARNLVTRSNSDTLEESVRVLTAGIFQQTTSKDRLRYLFEEWKIRLPMASAILTVLYPDEFTIYDKRVCDQLGNFHKLYNISNFEKLWVGYLQFREAVARTTPTGLSLRDRDRYLWGKSFTEQLEKDIANNFARGNGDD